MLIVNYIRYRPLCFHYQLYYLLLTTHLTFVIAISPPSFCLCIHHLKLYLHSIRFYYNPDIPFHLKHISYFTLSLRFLPPRPERSCSAVCPRRYSVDTLFCMVSRIQVATGPATQLPLHCCWRFPRLYQRYCVFPLFYVTPSAQKGQQKTIDRFFVYGRSRTC